MSYKTNAGVDARFILRAVFCALPLLSIAACGGGGGADASSGYTIGGTVSGLTAGTQATLYNNGGDAYVVTANRAFTFAAPVPATNGAYSVTVNQQPSGEICTITNGSGTATANVTNVAVTCSAAVAMVSTLAGSGSRGNANGTGTAASFFGPAGVAVDGSGNVYVADYGNNEIREITMQQAQ